jgi:hypothetical protein
MYIIYDVLGPALFPIIIYDLLEQACFKKNNNKRFVY